MASCDTNTCIMHYKKIRPIVENLFNKLRSCSLLPAKYFHFLPGLVCSCEQEKEKFKKAWMNVTENQLAESVYVLQEVLQQMEELVITPEEESLNISELNKVTQLCDAVKSLSAYLGPDWKYDESLGTDGSLQKSILKLNYIMLNIQRKDFTLFTPFVKDSPRAVTVDKEVTLSFHVQKGQHFLNYLIGKRGCNVKHFARKNCCSHVTVGQLDSSSSTAMIKMIAHFKFMEQNDETYVHTRMEKVRQNLKVFVEEHQQSFQKTGECLRQIRIQRNERNSFIYERNPGNMVFPSEEKDMRTESFHLKSVKHQADRNKRPDHSVLEKGHCLQCLKPFTQLSDVEVCQFHHGYIVVRDQKCLWSCCWVEAQEDCQTYGDHSNTGCDSLPNHVWRVNKKHDKRLAGLSHRKTTMAMSVPHVTQGLSGMEVCNLVEDSLFIP